MSQPINISASRGAAVLGVSSWRTTVDVWLEMMGREFCESRGYVYPEREESPAMRWGTAFESAVVELSENVSGRKIVDRERLYEKEYLTCHIDGNYNYVSGEHSPILHEGKTTSLFYWLDNFGDDGSDKIPVEYQVQCQHQMICTGATSVILSVLVFPKRVEEFENMGYVIEKHGDKYFIKINDNYISPSKWSEILSQLGYFHQYEINANPELQKLMLEKYSHFWNHNIIGQHEPEPVNIDDIRALCPKPYGTVIVSDEIVSLRQEYKDLSEEIEKLKTRQQDIKMSVIKNINSVDKIIDDDSTDKYIGRDNSGKKIFSFDGKTIRF